FSLSLAMIPRPPRPTLFPYTTLFRSMYYPYVEELGVFEQQDGFMDKELLTVADLSPEDLPLNQNWSWDRILRSCFIKQADVLQGDRKSTRLNSSHVKISYAVFCLKKK